MRFAYYAGASTALAGAVVLRAFHERPNFYSACVYLRQSNACSMILTNLVLLCTFCVLYGLQRLFFGPLRAIEIEQLYDKAWIAVTETCLAMTMFREHIGAWFLAMFVGLLAGKVWEWIGEGRVEFLEQQPPANPRVFHARLSASLLLSIGFDLLMLKYSVLTVVYEARPGMMVMFAFEFALLGLLSLSTSVRYLLSLTESYIVTQQTQARIEARRSELRVAREAAERDGDPERIAAAVADEDAFDADDVDVPGWERKGRWIFYLDLSTDFIKLVVYIVFFVILLIFHGLPIHILRDVFYTVRSFVKRIHDFARYRDATRDMNARYPDATVEELQRESTCIICREEMRPWVAPNADAQQAPPAGVQDERLRPKKLPCGHILHFGCLRSWLERQQVCPTCRRSVLVSDTPRVPNAPPQPGPNPQRPWNVGQPGAPHAPNQPRPPGAAQAPNQAPNQQPGNRLRVFNLGPLRILFGTGPENQLPHMMQQLRNNPNNPGAHPPGANPNAHQPFPQGLPHPTNAPHIRPPAAQNLAVFSFQLNQIERGLHAEQETLRSLEERLGRVQRLQADVHRRRAAVETVLGLGLPSTPLAGGSAGGSGGQALAFAPGSGAPSAQTRLGTGDPGLPSGLVLPPGWSLLPLQRLPPVTSDTPAATANSSHRAGDSGAGGLETAPGAQSSSVAVGDTHNSGGGSTSAQATITAPPVNGTPTAPPNPPGPSAAAPADSESTRAPDPPVSLPSPAAQPPPTAPSWSFGDAAETGSASHGEGERTETAGAAEQEQQDKGKGRAATVEDAADDEGQL